MTMYCKNTGSKGTISITNDSPGLNPDEYFVLEPGKVKTLPVWVALSAGFGRLWTGGHVTVSLNPDGVTSPISSVPAGEMGTTVVAASTSTAGIVKQAAAHADSSGAANVAALETAYNGLLAKLRTAGILAP